MTRFLKRYMKRAIIVLIVFLLATQIPLVKELLARGATTLYVAVKYPDQTITFEHFEYEPHFGEYIISYRASKSTGPDLTLAPKMLPIFVKYDRWDEPMSD